MSSDYKRKVDEVAKALGVTKTDSMTHAQFVSLIKEKAGMKDEAIEVIHKAIVVDKKKPAEPEKDVKKDTAVVVRTDAAKPPVQQDGSAATVSHFGAGLSEGTRGAPTVAVQVSPVFTNPAPSVGQQQARSLNASIVVSLVIGWSLAAYGLGVLSSARVAHVFKFTVGG